MHHCSPRFASNLNSKSLRQANELFMYVVHEYFHEVFIPVHAYPQLNETYSDTLK